MKRSILFLLFFFFTFTFIQAANFSTNYETILLKDGTIITGFLKSQDIMITKGNTPKVDVYVDKIERTVPDSIVGQLKDFELPIIKLNGSWKKWLDENPKYIIHKNDSQFVSLTQLVFKNQKAFRFSKSSSIKVKVLERGSYVKYIEFLQETISLRSSQISKIIYPVSSYPQMSGVYEYIRTFKGAEYEGAVKYLIPGKLLGIIPNDESNQIINLHFRDIQTREKRKYNEFQSLEEQIAFKDLIYIKNDTYIPGIIFRFNYDVNPQKSSLNILKDHGIIEQVYLNDIDRIERNENPSFFMRENISINSLDEIFVNDKKVTFVDYNDLDGNICFDENLSTIATFSKAKIGDKLRVYSMNHNLYLLKVEKTHQDSFMVEQDETSVDSLDQKPVDDSEEDMYVISYKDILKKCLPYKEIKYANKILERTYKVSVGDYVVYLPINDRVFLIRIKE